MATTTIENVASGTTGIETRADRIARVKAEGANDAARAADLHRTARDLADAARGSMVAAGEGALAVSYASRAARHASGVNTAQKAELMFLAEPAAKKAKRF